jgi:hypothetical protein
VELLEDEPDVASGEPLRPGRLLQRLIHNDAVLWTEHSFVAKWSVWVQRRSLLQRDRPIRRTNYVQGVQLVRVSRERTRASTRMRILAVAAVVVAVSSASGATATSGARAQAGRVDAEPTHAISALTAESTALPDVPAGLHDPSAKRSIIHGLGNGRAFAWRRQNEICWSVARETAFTACGAWSDEVFDVAIDPIIDPWPADPARPVRVFGLAVEDVTRVVATLTDGTAVATEPVNNWYEIEFPPSVEPWAIKRIDVRTADGATYFKILPTRRPSLGMLAPSKD